MGIDHLALPLLRATHEAAVACLNWVGRGDRKAADAAATEAMRAALSHAPVRGRVVIGDGEKDGAPMLAVGETVGSGEGFVFDLAVDPLEGTTACARGAPGAITVAAAAPAGSLYATAGWYMDKLVVGPRAACGLDIGAPIEDNAKVVASGLEKKVEQLSVVVLDKPRHRDLVGRLRALGCRVRLIPDGDALEALTVLLGGADLLAGIGGAPEGVLTACAVRCLGGDMQAALAPQSADESALLGRAGEQPAAPLVLTDLVGSAECCFVATGVTESAVLRAPFLPSDGSGDGEDGWSTQSFVSTPRHRGLLVETLSS